MSDPHFHTCSVPGCRAVLRSHLLMCRAHWRFVPHKLRAEVWAAWDQYRCGEITLSDLREVQDRATATVPVKVPKGGAA